MPKVPQISVGLPVYNGAQTLARAIESILRQDFADFELIVSDDCSLDNSVDIVKSYAASDARIRLIQHAENMGYVSNFEFLLSCARGKYFMWAGQDDYREPTYLRVLKTVLDEQPDKWVACPAVVSLDAHGAIKKTIPFPLEQSEQLFGMLWTMRPSAWIYGLFRRERLLELMAAHESAWQRRGGDVLLLTRCVLEKTVSGSNDTTIYKTESYDNPGEGGRTDYRPRPLSFMRFMLDHYLCAVSILFSSSIGLLPKLVLTIPMLVYLEKSLFYVRAVPRRELPAAWRWLTRRFRRRPTSQSL